MRLRIALPKGRLLRGVCELLEAAGVEVQVSGRLLRANLGRLEVKLFKPQNVPSLVAAGRFQLGFTGLDWLKEQNADLAVLIETGLDAVDIVAAAPAGVSINDLRSRSNVLVATEYPNLTRQWVSKQGIRCTILRTYGSTEVFPPEDADMIVDNAATGRTLREHGLNVLDVLMRSSTCLVANREALEGEAAGAIREMVTLLESALLARRKVLLEMNVPVELVDEILPRLPCMKAPTVAPLYGGAGYAIKIAVDEAEAPALVVQLKRMGATDILQYRLERIVP